MFYLEPSFWNNYDHNLSDQKKSGDRPGPPVILVFEVAHKIGSHFFIKVPNNVFISVGLLRTQYCFDKLPVISYGIVVFQTEILIVLRFELDFSFHAIFEKFWWEDLVFGVMFKVIFIPLLEAIFILIKLFQHF